MNNRRAAVTAWQVPVALLAAWLVGLLGMTSEAANDRVSAPRSVARKDAVAKRKPAPIPARTPASSSPTVIVGVESIGSSIEGTMTARLLRSRSHDFKSLPLNARLAAGDIIYSGKEDKVKLIFVQQKQVNSRPDIVVAEITLSRGAIVVVTDVYLDEQKRERCFRVLAGKAEVDFPGQGMGMTGGGPKKYEVDGAIEIGAKSAER